MQTLDINNKKISSAFIDATEAVAQYVKSKVIIDFRDSRHLSNVVITTNDAHANSNINEIGYYFDSYRAVDGFEYESFPWGVCDAKDNYGQTITASGKYRSMPSDLTDNLKYAWWSNSKSNSSGVFTTQPYIDINFTPTIMNKVKLVTTHNYGQIKSLSLAAVRSNGQTVFNQTINFDTADNQFEKIINLGNTYTNISRIYISVISTKNPNDRARLVSVSPLYRVDITDYIRDISENRVRDLHETSLPIAGTSQSSCDITIDNTTKLFNLIDSNSQYGKYLEKDIRVFISYGWLTYGKSEEMFTPSLAANLSSAESSFIYPSSLSRFPDGDVLDEFDESKYFVVTINKDKFNEEQILVRKKTESGELVIDQRGFNNTDPTNHVVGDQIVFDPFEYVQIGERYIEDIRSSTTDMTVSISTQDSSKFLNDKTIQTGFFRDSVTVPQAIRDLLLTGNHPYHKFYGYDRYHNFIPIEDAVLHFKFDDDPKNPGSSKIYPGLRYRIYQPPNANDSSIKDIQLDVNEKELSDLDRALGLSSSVSPSYTSVKSSIDLVAYKLSDDAPALSDSYYQGVIDGYLIPKNQYDPMSLTDGISISYDKGGVRVYIDDNLIIDGWNYVTSFTTIFAEYNFIIGVPYKIRVEFYHAGGTVVGGLPVSEFDLSLARTDLYTNVIQSDELVTNIITDHIGSRNPTLNGTQKNHHRNDAVATQFVDFSKNSSIDWFIEDKSISLSNTAANTSVVDSFIRLPYHESWDVTNSNSYPEKSWTIEYIFRAPNGPYGEQGEYISSFSNANSNSGIEFFYIATNNHGVKVKTINIVSNAISTATLVDSTNMPESNGWNHICVTYSNNNKTISYYVDGELKDSEVLSANVYPYWGNKDLTFGGRGSSFQANTGVIKPTSSIASNGINLDIDEFAIYKKAIPAEIVKKRYIETKIKEIKIFPFLYGINESIYQTMQNISFADLGRVYIDEKNVAMYDHYYALFEDSIDKYAEVQTTISDEDFIIDASIQKTLQVNSVIVKVAGVTASSLSTQSIWRAPDPTTLGVVNLDSNITANSNSIAASSFDIIPFPKSGYIIIDNEIIKYNNKSNTLFLDVERGMFGTAPASHSANTKIREVRYFNFEYDKTPCITVKPPFITGVIFEDPAEIDILKWVSSPFKANLIISASDTVENNSVVFAEGIDPTTNKVAYTSIAGIPVRVADNSNQIIEQKAVNSENRRKYGLKEIIIESPFITDASQAQILADFIISKLSEPIPIMEINASIIPTVQVGDRIKISTLDQFDIINAEYWITSINTFIGTQFSQSLTLRKVV